MFLRKLKNIFIKTNYMLMIGAVMGLLKLQNKVKEKLTNDRFIHTIGVQSTSFCLALTYGADYNNANYAGLLHDYAKCMTDVELLRLSKEFNLEISRVEEENPYLLHSKL